MSKKLLLFPFGGSAREVLVAILSSCELMKEWDVLGFVDDQISLKGKDCCGVKVLGSRDIMDDLREAFVLAVPAHPRDFLRRKEIIESLGINPDRFARVIHPAAIVAPDAKIGYNTFIAAHGFISTNVEVGNHCVVLSNTVISHDVRIMDYCCLGAHVTLSGGVSIGENCYIGSSVSIKENLRVEEKALVGIGANVVHPVLKSTIVIGNPAKEYFPRKTGD